MIDDYEKAFSTFLVHTFSGNDYTAEDVDVAKRNLIMFLNVLISSYVVYNWYFVMFFIDLNNERIKTVECSLKKLQIDSPVVLYSNIIFVFSV